MDSGLPNYLVIGVEDHLESVRTNTGVEVVSVFWRGSKPLADLFIVSNAGT